MSFLFLIVKINYFSQKHLQVIKEEYEKMDNMNIYLFPT